MLPARTSSSRVRQQAVVVIWSCALGSLAIAHLGAQPAQSGDTLKRLSLEALGNLEVTTTSKEPETVRRTPAAVYVLTADDIRRSGATSFPEALRLVPGLQVSRIDADHWAVGVRGFANQFSQSLLVLIDGRSLYTPLFAGVHWSVQDTVFADIERIEVIRGPGATIWGANAMNGVINIITKRAKDTRGATASIGAGNLDHAMATVRYGDGRDTGFDYRVYAKGFQGGPESHADGHDFDDWRTARGGFRADWSRNRDDVTLQGDIYKGRNGQSVTFGSYSPLAQIVAYDPLQVSGGNLVARWHRDLGSGDDVQVQAYYDRTFLLSPQIGESRNTVDVDFIHQVGRARRQKIIWGLGARLSPGTVVQTVPTLDVLPHDQTTRVYSTFAQDEIALVNNRVWLTLGSKFEHNNFTGLEVQPSARLLWMATNTQSLWGGITRAVRTPSLLEEGLQLTQFFQAVPPAFLRASGSPDFQSEQLLGYEAGYRGALTSQIYLDVAAFHNEHDNLQNLGRLPAVIEATPKPAHVLVQFPYQNGVTGTSDGIEVAPDWQPSRWWQLKGSYSYLHIDVRAKPGTTDGNNAVATYEGSSPQHQAFVRSLVTLPKGWEFDQTVRYASALPAQQVPAYAAVDLRVAFHVGRHIELSVTGQNLTQARHLEFGHAPPPAVALRRTVYATIAWIR